MQLKDVKEFLDEKADKYNQPFFIQTDPIQVPKNFSEKEDIEIAGFLTATIAWGSRTAIIKNAMKLMQLLNFQPYHFIRAFCKIIVVGNNYKGLLKVVAQFEQQVVKFVTVG